MACSMASRWRQTVMAAQYGLDSIMLCTRILCVTVWATSCLVANSRTSEELCVCNKLVWLQQFQQSHISPIASAVQDTGPTPILASQVPQCHGQDRSVPAGHSIMRPHANSLIRKGLELSRAASAVNTARGRVHLPGLSLALFSALQGRPGT